MKKKLGYAAAAVAVVAATFVAAPSAQAAARDGSCQSGEFCLYYNSDHTGVGLRASRPRSPTTGPPSRAATTSRVRAPVRGSP